MATYIIFGIIIIFIVLVFIKMFKDKKKGKCCGCSNSCLGCETKNKDN